MTMRSCLRCNTDFHTSMYAVYCNICQAAEANEKAQRRMQDRANDAAREQASQMAAAASALRYAQEQRAQQEWEYNQAQLEQQEEHNDRMAELEAERIAAIRAQTEQIRRNGLTPAERAAEDAERERQRLAREAQERADAQERKMYKEAGMLEAYERCFDADEDGHPCPIQAVTHEHWYSLTPEVRDDWVTRMHEIVVRENAKRAERERIEKEENDRRSAEREAEVNAIDTWSGVVKGGSLVGLLAGVGSVIATDQAMVGIIVFVALFFIFHGLIGLIPLHKNASFYKKYGWHYGDIPENYGKLAKLAKMSKLSWVFAAVIVGIALHWPWTALIAGSIASLVVLASD